MKLQIAAVALSLAAAVSVSSAQAAQSRSRAWLSDTASNAVTVQNDRKVPVTIYLEWGQFDRRLGVVPAQHTRTLALPAWAVSGRETVELLAHPQGAVDDLASDKFPLHAPARLAMLIPETGFSTPTPAPAMTAVIPSEELADATLTVENPRNVAVTVFAEQGPFDARLGRVPPRSTATLVFPKSVVLPDDSIRVFVQPDGELDLASETLPVHRGEHLGLKVPLR